MNNTAIVAAIGVGNLIQNCVVETLFLSFNSSLENLCSQAAGAKNLVNCGIYLNRGTLMIMISYLFVILILIFSDEILQKFGQDPKVSGFTAQYLLYYMPGFFIYGLSDLNKKFLNSFRLNFIPMFSFTISVFLHPFWSQYFVIEKDFKIIGIAIAGIITNSITFISLKVFKNTRNDLTESKVPFFDKSTFDRAGLLEYFWLGAPLLLINFLDFWMWELMTLSSGMISVDH